MTLKLNGTNSVSAPAYAGDDADTGLQCGTNELKLVTGGSARATVDSSGRLLVGTTASTGSHVLEVNGGTDNEVIKVESSDAGAYIRFEDDDTTGQIRLGAVDNDFKIDVNSAERLRINSSGNVGINTTTPFSDAQLTVGNGGSGNASIAWRRTGSGENDWAFSNQGGELKVLGGGDATTIAGLSEKVRFQSAGGISFNGDSAAANALHDYEEGTFTPRIVIENVGNIAIDNKNGSYVKVGSTVTAWFNCTVNGTPSGRSTSNAIEFHDFPFTSTNDGSGGAAMYVGSVRINDVDTSHTYGDFSEAIIRLNNNSTMGRIVLRDASSSGLANGSLWLKDNTTMHATITYRTDS